MSGGLACFTVPADAEPGDVIAEDRGGRMRLRVASVEREGAYWVVVSELVGVPGARATSRTLKRRRMPVLFQLRGSK